MTATGLPYFAYPYADWWRERLAGQLVRLSADKGLSLPFVGYWPDGVGQVALISHDSDGNVDEHAVSTLDVLADLQIHSTWCMLEPGYSADIYDRVRREGHELAFHYNAVEADDGYWAEEEFHRQFDWLKQAVSPTPIVSNKNHLTRVEGWGDLFRWCEAAGIASDQTRGPSKKGNVGFIYGTCHPYFPAAWADERNRIYPVLEIGFLSPDIDHGKWSDSGVIAPLLHQVKQVGGVLHMIFHQVHIHSRERVRQALYEVVRQARALDYSFWTGRMIVEWTQQRRSLIIREVDRQGVPIVSDEGQTGEGQSVEGPLAMGQTAAEQSAGQAVVWVPVSAEVRSRLDPSVEITFHYGIACRKYVTPNRK